jgi:hypothetical protein
MRLDKPNLARSTDPLNGAVMVEERTRGGGWAMPALGIVIIVASTVFLFLIVYMEWIGFTSLFTAGWRGRYAYGHVKVRGIRNDPDHCWTCRHPRAAHLLQEAAHPIHHAH